MRFAPARRRGYAKRYLRHQLGQHGVELLLAAAFLLGVLLGCRMTSEENIAVGTAGQLFDAGGQLLCSSCRFAVHSLFKRLGCCFSAVGAVGAVLARHGIWCTGCLLLCCGTIVQQPVLPAGASSTGVGGGAAADLCGRMCAAFFQPLFLCTLSKRSL